MRQTKIICVAVLLVAQCLNSKLSAQESADQESEFIPAGFKLQWRSDFSDANSLSQLELTDPATWRLGKLQGKPALELVGGSRYRYKVQSPSSIALIKTHRFNDFLLEAELVQNGREYGHRDLCLFFGFQDAGHYYYAHFASKTDDRANQIFIVDDKPFTKISSKTTKGSYWGRDQWRKVRIQRVGSQMTVWFNDMSKPAMLADNKKFGAGHIGFGSYNDSGMFANVRIWAPNATQLDDPPTFFANPGN